MPLPEFGLNVGVASTATRDLPTRAKRDAGLRLKIRRVWEENFRVHGVRKLWRRLRREGVGIARCTTARLMRQMGLDGAIRGKAVKATVGNPAAPGPRDTVNRRFRAARPNLPWLADFAYVATWQGFVFVAFVIDALEQALHDRRPVRRDGLVHHGDRGSQYVSICYTERLAEAGIEPSVGSVGDSCDNALDEIINGLFKADLIHRRGPWRSADSVEFATLERVEWFNNRRLLEPIGNIPPAEAEARYYARLNELTMAARLKQNRLRESRGGSVQITGFGSSEEARKSVMHRPHAHARMAYARTADPAHYL